MIGHLVKRAQDQQRENSREDFIDFCRRQRIRIRYRLGERQPQPNDGLITNHELVADDFTFEQRR